MLLVCGILDNCAIVADGMVYQLVFMPHPLKQTRTGTVVARIVYNHLLRRKLHFAAANASESEGGVEAKVDGQTTISGAVMIGLAGDRATGCVVLCVYIYMQYSPQSHDPPNHPRVHHHHPTHHFTKTDVPCSPPASLRDPSNQPPAPAPRNRPPDMSVSDGMCCIQASGILCALCLIYYAC